MIDFPAAPVDGQTYVASNGVSYRWHASPGVWISELPSLSTTGSGNIVVLQNSPTLIGDPKAPTPPLDDDSTSIATTEFVKAQGYASVAYVDEIPTVSDGELALLAGKDRCAVLRYDSTSPMDVAYYHQVDVEPAQLYGKFMSLDGKWFKIMPDNEGRMHASWFGDGVAGLKRALATSDRVRTTDGGLYDFTNEVADFIEITEKSVEIIGPQSVFRKSVTGTKSILGIAGEWEAQQNVLSITLDVDGFPVLGVVNGAEFGLDQVVKIISNDVDTVVSGVFVGAGEWSTIKSITGNNITLSGPLNRYGIYTTSVRIARPNKALTLKLDLGTLEFAPGVVGSLFFGEAYIDPDVHIRNAPYCDPSGSSIVASLRGCYGGNITIGYWAGGPMSSSYGVRLSGCCFTRMQVKASSGGRHVMDMGSRGAGLTDFAAFGANYFCVGYGSSSFGSRAASFAMHHNTWGCWYEDCESHNSYGGAFSLRGIKNGAKMGRSIGDQQGMSAFQQDDDIYQTFGTWFDGIEVNDPTGRFFGHNSQDLMVTDCVFRQDVGPSPAMESLVLIEDLATSLSLSNNTFCDRSIDARWRILF